MRKSNTLLACLFLFTVTTANASASSKSNRDDSWFISVEGGVAFKETSLHKFSGYTAPIRTRASHGYQYQIDLGYQSGPWRFGLAYYYHRIRLEPSTNQDSTQDISMFDKTNHYFLYNGGLASITRDFEVNTDGVTPFIGAGIAMDWHGDPEPQAIVGLRTELADLYCPAN